MVNLCKSNLTERPYGLSGRFEGYSNIMLPHAQIPARNQCFGIPQILNPKTLNPKPENTDYICLYRYAIYV